MDHDRSGSISPDEMRKYLASTNIPPEAIDALIHKMDKDGDGSITRQEFALGHGERSRLQLLFKLGGSLRETC